MTPVRLQDPGLCCTMAPGIPIPESTMEFRRLGDSGLEVSVLCLGTMMFGDRTDAAVAQRIIGSAFDAGVNFIDTADVYAKGASETIVGPAIAANRRRWILATKVGNVMTKAPHDGGLSRRWIMQACDDSLKRLATDYIDIYYLHKDDTDTPLVETIAAIGDLIRSGQDPLLRRVQLSRLAHRRSRGDVRRSRRAAAGRLPALLQRDEPHARGRDPAGLRLLRHRRRSLQPARARRAHRQIRAGRGAAARFARRAQGPADDGNRIPRRIDRHGADDQGARGNQGSDGDAVRARLGAVATASSARSSADRARSSNGTTT